VLWFLRVDLLLVWLVCFAFIAPASMNISTRDAILFSSAPRSGSVQQAMDVNRPTAFQSQSKVAATTR
jgi:hypothetical protein